MFGDKISKLLNVGQSKPLESKEIKSTIIAVESTGKKEPKIETSSTKIKLTDDIPDFYNMFKKKALVEDEDITMTDNHRAELEALKKLIEIYKAR